MKEFRCGFCRKLLAKLSIKTAIKAGTAEIKIEIKCKCGKMNTFEEKSEK